MRLIQRLFRRGAGPAPATASRPVPRGSYLVVLDTVVEDMPKDFFPDRPWGPGDNPRTAVREFLKGNARFTVDQETEDKLLLTTAPGGYLRCVAD